MIYFIMLINIDRINLNILKNFQLKFLVKITKISKNNIHE